MESSAESSSRCLTCGADLEMDAAYCPRCGSPSMVAAPPNTVGPSAAPLEAPQAVLPGARAASPPQTEQALSQPGDGGGGPQKRCEWCGALNAEADQVCQQCGAAFPRPDQDAALLRASQDRIRMATDSIETIRKERERKGFGRLFGR